jgi:hypothetical protein
LKSPQPPRISPLWLIAIALPQPKPGGLDSCVKVPLISTHAPLAHVPAISPESLVQSGPKPVTCPTALIASPSVTP